MNQIVLILAALFILASCGAEPEQVEKSNAELKQAEKSDAYEPPLYMRIRDKYLEQPTLEAEIKFVSNLSDEELMETSSGATIATWLVRAADKAAIEYIIKERPHVTSSNKDDIREEFWDVVYKRDFGSELIDFNIMNQYGYNGGNSLHFIAHHNKDTALFERIELPKDINKKNRRGESALNIAIQGNYTELVSWLVEHNASLSIAGENGNTALHYMAINMALNPDDRFSEDVLLPILSKSSQWISASEIRNDSGAPPLSIIAYGGDSRLFYKLVDLGWDPYVSLESGTTAFLTLQYALDNVKPNGEFKNPVVMPESVSREK